MVGRFYSPWVLLFEPLFPSAHTQMMQLERRMQGQAAAVSSLEANHAAQNKRLTVVEARRGVVSVVFADSFFSFDRGQFFLYITFTSLIRMILPPRC